MCGIAGFVGKGASEDLSRMLRLLSHRGPDGAGAWCDRGRGVYLGHTRLAIVDLADGHQPMWTTDGRLGVVFNGEIYNHQALRAELERAGHVFTTDHSDTEVLLHGYREWGEALTHKLNGMWAFALYDQARQRLFCSRDRFGKKPFYYTFQQDTLVFASELTALLTHPHVTATVSTRAIQKYIGYGYIPAPHTPYEGIFKLPAGCSLSFALQERVVEVERYWSFVLEPTETRPAGFERQCQEELTALLDQAVARRLVADVPVGVFLSGGVDSSAVAALAARRLEPGQLQTFSIGFDEKGFDESGYARQMAEHIEAQHHEQILRCEAARALLPEVVRRLDEPTGDSSLLPTYLLCRFARESVTVALGGDGADELFGGYAPFRALKWAGYYQKAVPKPVHQVIQLLTSHLPVLDGYMSLDFKLKRAIRGVGYPSRLWNPVWMCPLDEQEFAELFQQPVDLDEVFSEAIDAWERCSQTDPVDRTLQFFTDIYLQDDILAKTDRASMMNSLELRSPFLDIDVVNLARTIPSDYKIRHGETKYILKKAMEPFLPRDTLRRPKQGFAAPVAQWLRGRSLFSEKSGLSCLNNDFIDAAFADHACHRKNHHSFLWSQWVLGMVVPPRADGALM
nr:asparagine synthase (glutamine-hydrolyzing) [uncultured Pseudogulbenkiania sp.]